MKLNHFLENEECAGRYFTACLNWMEGQNMPDEDIIGVYGSNGQILYMSGESVLVTRVDERNSQVAMSNSQNTEGYVDFMIPFAQFQRDFGMWPPLQISQ